MNKKIIKFDKLLEEYRNYAKTNGFCLNPNQEIVAKLINSLIEREEKYGKKYCPCRQIGKNEKENEKIICPCIYHKEEISRDGHCHCFLFVK